MWKRFVLLVPGVVLMILASPPSARASATATESISYGGCQFRTSDLVLDRDPASSYISYGARGVCTRPISYTLSVELQEKIGGAWIKIADSYRAGVSQYPTAFGVSTPCESSAMTTFRPVVIATVQENRRVVEGNPVQLPCNPR